MSADKKQQKDNAAALLNRAPRKAGDQAPTQGAGAAPRTKDVRLTTTLAPLRYRGLQGFCAETAEELGATRVTHAVVVRALIARLETDPALRAAVKADVAAALETD